MKKILVADDSVTIQKVIALTFADEPFEVQSVGTGAEALERIKTWKPDVLLADVIMPQMNGYELCRAVKDQQETSSVPVLLLAGTFEAFDEEEAKSVGADGYVTKPFESGELIERVNAMVGGMPGVKTPSDSQVELSPEEIPEAGAPPVESLQVEPVQEEPAQGEPAQMEPDQAASFPMDAVQTPSEGIFEPGQARQTTPEPVQIPGKKDEPDIWDILSDTEGGVSAPESGVAGAAVPGMGPIEDKSVIDFGSFDVGLDRPEPVVTLKEPPAQAETGIPSVPVEPESISPISEKPVETPVTRDQPTFDAEQPDQLSPEKSRVEDREKDFFGFETEAPETAGESEFLGDAVEEITFDMDEPAGIAGDVKPEEPLVVPEAEENEIPAAEEPLSPEFLAPEEPIGEEEPRPADEISPPTNIAEPLQAAEPSASREEAVYQLPETPGSEPIPETRTLEPEPSTEPETIGDLENDQPSEEAPPDVYQDVSDAEIRRIIEEKVEKVVWEVVPEMAEVLIREAIEKIKGKP